MHIKEKSWRGLLGADVNNLEHLRLTYGLTRAFLRSARAIAADDDLGPAHLRFTDEEERQLLFTAIVHDWGEAIVGDISYDQKTDDQEAQEWSVLGELTKDFGPVAGVRTGEILKDTGSKLGRSFNVVERIGYLRTGLRAWRLSAETDDPTLASHLRWLTQNVLMNQIPALCELAADYPMVAAGLARDGYTISDAFREIDDTVLAKYDEGAELAAESHRRARLTWLDYRAKTP